jgi:hypothetical protein
VFTVAEHPVFSPMGSGDAHSDQPLDAREGIVGGRGLASCPHRPEDLLAREHPPVVSEQVREQLKLGAFQAAMPGSIRSSTIASKLSLSASRSPSVPSVALATSKPRPFKPRRRKSRIPGSSSMTSTRAWRGGSRAGSAGQALLASLAPGLRVAAFGILDEDRRGNGPA